MNQSVDSVVPLIHAWLKENHLLKAARILEEEYGKEIPHIDGASTTIQYACMMHSMFSLVLKKTPIERKPEIKKKHKKKKRKDNTANKNEAPKSVSTKKVKTPLDSPQEMMFPEMLERIYERQTLGTANLISDSGSSKQTSGVLSNGHSDSDSNDFDVAATERTIVTLSDGLILTPEHITGDRKESEVKKSAKKNIVQYDTEGEKNVQQSKKKSKKDEEIVEKIFENDAIVQKSAKKKKRKHDKEEYVPTESERKKKKKKKKQDSSDNENFDETVTETVTEVEKKKKKKRKKKA